MIAPTPGTRRAAAGSPRWLPDDRPQGLRPEALRLGGVRPRGGGLGGQHRGDRQHAGQRLDRLFGGLAQRLQARAALGLDLDREGDIAVADCDPRNHAERDDVAAASGSAIAGKRVEDLSFGDGHLIPQSAGRP